MEAQPKTIKYLWTNELLDGNIWHNLSTDTVPNRQLYVSS